MWHWKRTGGTLLLCLGMLWGVNGTALGQAYDWQYGLSLTHSSGDYGEPFDTDMLYIPASAKRYWEQGDLTLTVPVLSISSDGNATVVDGSVVASGASSSGSGLGDVVLKGRYYLVEQEGRVPYVDLAAKLKLPTADEGDGLGTGETDFGLIVELSQWIDTEYLWLAELGYTFIGDPAGTDYDNRVSWSLGAGKVLDPEWQVTAYLDGRSSLLDRNDDPLSLLLIGEYKRCRDLRFDGMLELGLNDGAPDYSITFGARLKR